MPSSEQLIADAAAAVRQARRIGVLTGAGMSVASGLPTYRGIGGLYNDMSIEEGMPIEDILHAYTMARNPALTWKYIAQIEQACRGAEPNTGHYLLARWDDERDVQVITQNVDGFHRRAGSRNVIELHGNLARLYCVDCEADFTIDALNMARLPPRCTDCDGLVRPDVVLFGEMLPDAALRAYHREIATGFDVLLCIGTSAAFPYIHEPVVSAARAGTTTIEINPDATDLSSDVAIHVQAGAVEALEVIDQALR